MVMNVTILGTGGEALAVWAESDAMDCTEMTLDVSEDLVIYYAVKFHLETTLGLLSRRDILSVLSAACEEVELLVLVAQVEWADGAVSAWELEVEFSNLIEGFWVEELDQTVSAASEEHGEVFGHRHGEYFVSVNVLGEHEVILLEVVFEKSTLIGAIVDSLIESAPLDVVNDMVSWSLDFLIELWCSFALTPLQCVLNMVDSHGALSISILEHNYKHLIAEGELDLLGDNTWRLDLGQMISVLAVKDLDSLGSGGGKQILAVLGHIN